MTSEGLLHVDAWVAFGMIGQMLFAGRFVVQWVASERRGESVVPPAFWYLSLAGGVTLLVYASWHRRDPVFTIGQAAGIAVYLRNLVLIRRARPRAGATAHGPGA